MSDQRDEVEESGIAGAELEGMGDRTEQVEDPPEPEAVASVSEPSRAQRAALPAVVAFVVSVLGTAGMLYIWGERSERAANRSDDSATKAEAILQKIDVIQAKAGKSADAAAEMAFSAKEEADRAAQASGEADKSEKAAAGHLGQMRQAAKQVAADANRAVAAAASTEKALAGLNVEEFRNTIRAEQERFRAELHNSVGTNGDSFNFHEEFAALRKEMVTKEEMSAKHRAIVRFVQTEVPAGAGKEIQRFHSLKGRDRKQYLSGMR